MDKPYKYSGMEAASYDLVDELSDFDDYPFYRFLIEASPGSVLDLGCGTGRILVGLAEEGIDVTGLDVSREMLDICEEKLAALGREAPLVYGDIRSFDLSETFDTILIPGFTIQLLLSSEDLDACLKSCTRHLKPGGQLVVSTYLPWEMLESGLKRKPLEKKRESDRDTSGESFAAWQGWEIDRIEQRLQLSNRFQKLDSAGEVLSEENLTMTLCWHLPYDMQRLLQKHGLGDISLYGDFTFDPPEADTEAIVYVGRRPG